MIDFARWTHGKTIQQAIEDRHEDWTAQCYCDYSFHVMVEGALPPEIFGQLAEALRAGYPTVKIFTTDITPSRRGRMVDFGDIWEVFKVVAQERGMCVMHGEDNDIVMHMYDKLIREGRTGFENMAEVHNAMSEDLSFRRVLGLAKNVPGIALYFMHVSAGFGVEAIREARARGLPVYGETLHQYLMYTSRRLQAAQRPDVSHLSVDQGQVRPGRAVAGDERRHAAYRGDRRSVLLARGQNDGQAHRRHDGRQRGRRAARVAHVHGDGRPPRLLARKIRRPRVDQRREDHGAVSAQRRDRGRADADITVLDPARRTTIRKEMLHESDYTPWEGHEVHAWPALTVLRGKVVVDDGKFTGDLKDGQYLLRKISDEIRSSAAL